MATVSDKKRHGIHYTPPALAHFLARRTVDAIDAERLDADTVRVLDPACGDGELLIAVTQALLDAGHSPNQIIICGFDQDAEAVDAAQQRLKEQNVGGVNVQVANFLDVYESLDGFDCVISNPPYVRTQALGGAEAQRLAQRFELKGRIDLYQVFTAAMLECLNPGAALGLLTSNRFLTVKAGASMRTMLRTHLQLKQIFDLGDSKLFDAAVLPVILTGNKVGAVHNQSESPEFCRVARSDAAGAEQRCLLETLEQTNLTGAVGTQQGTFEIQRGSLTGEDVWRLTNKTTERWLKKIRSRQCYRFADVATIKVGIKTTADKVFISDNWPADMELLQPLLTHHVATPWRCQTSNKRVLYPYDLSSERRTTVDLSDHPTAAAYLRSHKTQLAGRKYLMDAGRQWYEIWVAHQPSGWQQPKVVWPDISEHPKFFLDNSGAVVNGDCYWLTLREGFSEDWLYLILAIANSSIATQYYDFVFCNKLYAGRRRFMTQYVADFPLPDLSSELSQRVVGIAKELTAGAEDDGTLETMVEELMLGK